MQRRLRAQQISRRSVLLGAASAWGMGMRWGSAASSRNAISVTLPDRQLVGLPLVWEGDLGLLLDRGGRLWKLDPRRLDVPRDAGVYQPATPQELGRQLAAELPRQFRIQHTQHYLIACDADIKTNWTGVFERLHGRFCSFFSRRGIRSRQGRFPMIALITKTESEMLRLAASVGDPSRENALGMYSQMTNRMYLYDHGAFHGGTSATIRHEVAHQSAFNTGIHPRLTDTPLWVIEGIGALFEAEPIGSSNASDFRSRAGTLYPIPFLSSFPDPARAAEAMMALLGSDDLFNETAEEAYQLAWALTFYLTERRTVEYGRLLARLGRLKPLAVFPAALRRHEFEKIFGDDHARLAADMYRFVESCVE